MSPSHTEALPVEMPGGPSAYEALQSPVPASLVGKRLLAASKRYQFYRAIPFSFGKERKVPLGCNLASNYTPFKGISACPAWCKTVTPETKREIWQKTISTAPAANFIQSCTSPAESRMVSSGAGNSCGFGWKLL